MRIGKPIVVFFIILGVIAAMTVFFSTVHIYSDEYDILPTCETEGGRYHRCIICGKNVCLFETDPTGHTAEWKKLSEASAVNKGLRQLRCSYCNKLLESELIHTVIYQQPTIHLYGGGYMSYYVYDDVKFTFTGREEIMDTEQQQIEERAIDARIRIYNEKESQRAKFNYLVRDLVTNDTDINVNLKKYFSDSFIIYANNDDNTTFRRGIFLDLWKKVSSDYPFYTVFMTNNVGETLSSENILLYIRNLKPTYTFSGIYTIAPDYSSFVNDSSHVRYVVKYDDASEEKLQFIYGDESDKMAILDRLDTLLCESSNPEEFTSPELLSDYAAFSLLTANTKAFSEIYWVSSDGSMWYPVPEMSQHVFGAVPGEGYLSSPSYSHEIPEGFWRSFLDNYADDINKSQKRLTSDILSVKNVIDMFNTRITMFEDILYEDNATVSGARYESPESAVSAIVSWYEERINYLNKE